VGAGRCGGLVVRHVPGCLQLFAAGSADSQ
jgi:hypothetical protein